MTPNIKLVAIDLDGTLLADNHSTDPANLTAIHQAEAQGVTVVICTGRPYPSANEVASQLGLTENPIISYNGALVRMPGDGEVLFSQPVPAELAEQVVQDCVERQLQIHYFLDDVMYVPRMSAGARLYSQRTGMQPVPAGDLRKFAGSSPTKILVFAGPEVVQRLRPEFESRYDGKLYITTSMPEYLEFLHPDVSKGNALCALANQHGLDASQTMAIGDLLNDLPMIEMAGVGVAVARAEEALKSAADYVTDSSSSLFPPTGNPDTGIGSPPEDDGGEPHFAGEPKLQKRRIPRSRLPLQL